MSRNTTITLDGACEFIVDCLHKTAPFQEAGYPMIRTPNIGKGRLLLDGVFRVSEETYQTWTQRAAPEPGDLILAREAPAGNVALVTEGEKVCLGQRTVHLRPRAGLVDGGYLCNLLLTSEYQGKLLAGETGVTAKHVNLKDIRRLTIENLPPIGVQRRMALLEESARQLYQEWFVRLRFPGHEHTRITDGVPEGWERKRLGECYDTASGGTPSRSVPDYFGGDIPWVKTGELLGGFIIDTEEKITDVAVQKSAAKFFPARTVLVALYGATVGALGILAMPATTNQACCAVIPKEDSPGFAYVYLALSENRERLVGLSAGAAQKNISQQLVREFPILVPPHALLQSFRSFTEPSFQQIEILQRQNQKLRAARDLLLPRLMSGEVAV